MLLTVWVRHVFVLACVLCARLKAYETYWLKNALALLSLQVKKVKTEYLKDPAFTLENVKTISTAGAGKEGHITNAPMWKSWAVALTGSG